VAAETAAKARGHDGHLAAHDRDRVAAAMFAPTSRYLAAVARRGGKDQALRETRADLRADEWYDIAAGKGVLVLAELRSRMGDGPFLRFMDAFGQAHAGAPVDSAEFLRSAEQAHGKPMPGLADAWLGPDALAHLGADARARHAAGRFWAIDSFERQLEKAVIVYGTTAEAEIQREAAAALQRKLAARFANVRVPVKADVEVNEGQLKDAHILLVGRPSTNRWSARLAGALPVRFGPSSVQVGDETFANPRTAIVAAGPSPMAADRSVVIFAGLGTEGTWNGVRRFPDHGGATAEVMIMEADGPLRRLAVPCSTNGRGIAAAE
jgi:hypothetical protein